MKVNTIKDGLPVFDSARDDLLAYDEDATYEIRIYKTGEPVHVHRP